MESKTAALMVGIRHWKPGATQEAINRVETALGFGLPTDYKAVMAYANGWDGPIGPMQWLRLWPIEQLPEHNQGYEVATRLPGITLFGTNGGIDFFAFDRRVQPWQYLVIPFPLSLGDAEVCGSSFHSFLTFLAKYE